MAGTKVKTIAQAQRQQSEQTKSSKKPFINQKKQTKQNNDSNLNTQLLTSINNELKSLNTNILKISTTQTKNVKTNASDKSKNDFSKPPENQYGSNFQKGLNDALIALVDSSNFRTKLKQMYTASLPQFLYQVDSSDKIAKEVSKISQVQKSSSYAVQNADRAVNTEEYVNQMAQKSKSINDNISKMVQTINQSSTVKDVDSLSASSSGLSTKQALNTSTQNQQINSMNSKLLQIAKDKQNNVKKQEQLIQNANQQANKNSEVIQQLKDQSVESAVSKNTQKKQAIDKEIQPIDDNIKQTILQASNQITTTFDKNTQSLNKILNQKAKDKAQMKTQKQTKKSFFQNLFKRKTGSSQKSPTDQLVKGSKQQENSIAIDKKPKSFTNKIKSSLLTIGKTFKAGAERKKLPTRASAAELLRHQKTFSKKDSNSNLRDFEVNAKNVGITDSKKTTTIAGKTKQESGVKQLTGIHSLLAGFLSFYKKSAKDQADRELYRLRFGSESEDKSGSFLDKFKGLFKSKGKQKGGESAGEKVKKGAEGLGIIGGIIALIWGGIKFFGGWLGKKILKGLGTAIKWIAKGAWKLIKWIAPKIWAALKWVGGKIWTGLKWIWGKVWPVLKSIGTTIYNFFKKIFGPLFKKIGTFIKSSFGKITRLFGKVFGKILGPIGRVFKGIFNKLGPLIKKIFGPLTKVFAGVFGKIFSGIGKLILPLLSKIPFIGKFFGGKGGRRITWRNYRRSYRR